ncbi:MAG: dimethylsulfonioproprionate lyase family protein [Pseudomonadota bacterium]
MTTKPLLNAFRDYLSLRAEKKVQEWVSAIDWNMSERNLPAVRLPAERHLNGIDEFVGRGEKNLVNTFADLAPNLHWLQSYKAEDVGEHMIANYGFVELLGTRGHFSNNEFAGGVGIFGPGIHYPNHWHVAEECYFTLTGGGLWGRDDGPLVERAAGEFVFHESNMHHEMKVKDIPLLVAYLWRGGDLAQKSDF